MKKLIFIVLAVFLASIGIVPALSNGRDQTETAWQMWREGRIEEAHASAQSILQRDPDDDRARHLRIVTSFIAGDYEGGLEQYNSLNSDYAEYDSLTGAVLDAYLHLDRVVEAAAFARRMGRPEPVCTWLQRRADHPMTAALEATTVIPFTEDNWLRDLMPAVPIELNGQPFTGHLDTGGSYIATSPKMVAELGIEVSRTGTGIANNQPTTISLGLVDSLKLGEALLTNVPVASLDALSGQVENLIILGTRILSRFLVTWDNVGGRLILTPRGDPAARERHIGEFSAGGEATRFYLAGDHYMWAHGSVGDRDVLFFVDTGLVTIDDTGHQPGLSVPAETLSRWGVDVSQARFVHDLGPIRLGPGVRKDTSILVARGARNLMEFHGLVPDALISHGFLKGFVWTIDFDRRQYLLAGAAETPPEPSPGTLDPKKLVAYVGVYEIAPGVMLEVTSSGGTLYLQVPGQQKVPMTPGEEPDTFEIRLAGATILFVRDATGAVTELVLRQAGSEQRGRKVH